MFLVGEISDWCELFLPILLSFLLLSQWQQLFSNLRLISKVLKINLHLLLAMIKSNMFEKRKHVTSGTAHDKVKICLNTVQTRYEFD